MKPISLHGHERAITQIKYNRDGDLLLSAAKDASPNVWFSSNGERLGSFEGHSGVVWTIDCSWDSTKVVTGSGDNTLRIWDLEYGKELNKLQTRTSVRIANFSYSGKMLFYTTDEAMKLPASLGVIDLNDSSSFETDTSGVISIDEFERHNKPTSGLWGPLDESIITGHETGILTKWDFRSTKEKLLEVQKHKAQINDLQYSKDQTMFVTASKDTSAKLFDSETFDHLKTYQTDRPVNSAAISPIRDHVVLGGGQEAMEVTTTSTRAGKFEARFYHLIFEEEFARVKGHFGPINSVAFHPNGLSYASGGEDGYVRLHTFDSNYLEYNFEY